MKPEGSFVRHQPCADRIVFALTLDRKKMKERIMIGDARQIYSILDRDAAGEQMIIRMGRLTSAFWGELFRGKGKSLYDEDTGRTNRFELSTDFFARISAEDAKMEVWYPGGGNRLTECAVVSDSFYPLIGHYTNRLADWGLKFCKCKICGKIFLAESLRYELCGGKCRKAQALQNKRDFDARARQNHYDLLYQNECQSWRNKIRRAERTEGFPVERLQEMQEAFENFKKDALQRKNQVKEYKMSPQEFKDWHANLFAFISRVVL